MMSVSIKKLKLTREIDNPVITVRSELDLIFRQHGQIVKKINEIVEHLNTYKEVNEMKLKTLNDIEDLQQEWNWKSELRKEAIKWVKEYERSKESFIDKLADPTYLTNPEWREIQKAGIVGWIKHFFSLKESDINEDNK